MKNGEKINGQIKSVEYERQLHEEVEEAEKEGEVDEETKE